MSHSISDSGFQRANTFPDSFIPKIIHRPTKLHQTHCNLTLKNKLHSIRKNDITQPVGEAGLNVTDYVMTGTMNGALELKWLMPFTMQKYMVQNSLCNLSEIWWF